MKKKVLLMITKSEPLGGAGRYVLDLATRLPKEHFDVVVVVGGEGVLKTQLQGAGIRTISIAKLKRDISLFAEFSAFFTLISILKQERPHIVHLNSSKAGGLGALAARLCGVNKIVFTGHGWAFNEDRGFVSRNIITALHWVTILLAHNTIAVSKKTADDIRSLPFVSRRVVVIHNGIPEIDFVSRDEARNHLASFSKPLQQHLEGHPSAFWIGINGELHHNKGIDVAITAIAPLLMSRKNIALVVTGSGEERERLHQQKMKVGADIPIFFLGNVPDMRRYLKAHDLFCMPSRTEALPYAVLEAARAELPVIASNVGGIPEIVTDQTSGILVPKEHAEDLRKAVLACLDTPETCSVMGTALRNTVATHFSTDAMTQKTIAVYNS